MQCTTCGYNVSLAFLDEVDSCGNAKFPVDRPPAGIGMLREGRGGRVLDMFHVIAQGSALFGIIASQLTACCLVVDVGHVFGVPVETNTMPGHQAPPLVEKCIAAIENGKAFKTSVELPV
jgi:hypothetical protein